MTDEIERLIYMESLKFAQIAIQAMETKSLLRFDALGIDTKVVVTPYAIKSDLYWFKLHPPTRWGKIKKWFELRTRRGVNKYLAYAEIYHLNQLAHQQMKWFIVMTRLQNALGKRLDLVGGGPGPQN